MYLFKLVSSGQKSESLQMRINSSRLWVLMAEAFLWLCLKNGPPHPWDAQGSQGLPHGVPGWWHRAARQTVSARKYLEKRGKTPHFHCRLCCKSLPVWPGSSNMSHFSFPHLLLCWKICLLKIHSGLRCGLMPRLLQVTLWSGCFNNSNGIKVQG